MIKGEDIKHIVDGSSFATLLLYIVDKLPYWASLVAAAWVFLRVYDYILYVRPKLIQESKDATKSDPTDI